MKKPVTGTLLRQVYGNTGHLTLELEMDSKQAARWGNETYQAHLRGQQRAPVVSLTVEAAPKPVLKLKRGK